MIKKFMPHVIDKRGDIVPSAPDGSIDMKQLSAFISTFNTIIFFLFVSGACN
jgi:hypothetical protein